MPAYHSRATRLALVVALGAAASACGSFDSMSNRIVGSITPYRVEVVQGNFVSKEQVEALRAGMNRQQVREVLGSPLVADLFHADRWDYVFTLDRQGVPKQERHLTVFFKNNLLERFEGDTMPTEAEFVATLGSKYKGNKIPQLEASEESLKSFTPGTAPAAPKPAAELPPLPASYPPLESTP
jgi:outer membrane protein assembly factor BamE